MTAGEPRPSVVLICHADDPVDREGIAAWLASSFRLAGIVEVCESPCARLRRLRREYRRVGLLRLCDVLLFRVFYRLRHARADKAWAERESQYLKNRYPAGFGETPRLAARTPNSAAVREFLHRLQPDLVLARCKYILRPEIYNIPRYGSYVLHPGVCPEYRNAHGCFWALARRDLDRVGMTLLRVDAGVDTGAVFLQASYPFDEEAESHVVIQYRVVLENLEAITAILYDICRGAARPLSLAGRCSMSWGQPWLSAYLRWRHAVHRTAPA